MDCLGANACWNDIQHVYIIQSENNMTLYFSSILSFFLVLREKLTGIPTALIEKIWSQIISTVLLIFP